MNCPLCKSSNYYEFLLVKEPYFKCSHCDLVYMDKKNYLSTEEEVTHYNFHQNSPLDENYRNFFRPMFDDLISYFPESSKGLDYGCGPGPTLSVMLEEMGHTVDIYDIHYYPNNSISNNYDFITMTEVIEHLPNPSNVLQFLKARIREDGILAIMTYFMDDIKDFKNWHYRRDPTHKCFYTKKTASFIANIYDFEILEWNKKYCLYRI